MTALKGRGRVVETKATVGSLKFRTHSFIISLDLVITAWSSFHTDPTKLIIHPILYTSLSTHTHTRRSGTANICSHTQNDYLPLYGMCLVRRKEQKISRGPVQELI